MPPIIWNPAHLSLRDYFWRQCFSSYLETCNVKTTADILEFTGNAILNFSDLILSVIPKGTLDTISISAKNLVIDPDSITPSLQKIKHDIVFGFFRQDEVQLDKTFLFLQYCYNALLPTGRFLIIIPSSEDSALHAYQKVIDSNEFSSLSDSPLIDHEKTLLKNIRKQLQQSDFVLYKFNTYSHNIELPTLTTFKSYLQNVSFPYKKMLHTEINEAISNKQVEYFEEDCQQNHGGKYIFNYKLNIISAVK